MAKKKNISRETIISFYMDYVLEHDQQPKSIFSFAKVNNFEESLFYTYFGNFNTLEEHVFESFFKQTLLLLEKSDDYQEFDARNKLLSFYFTFFELLTANRSYVVYALKNNTSKLKSIKVLSGLRKVFTDYVSNLDVEFLDLKHKNLDSIQKKSLKEGAWLQLILTLKFWLEDTSPAFDKTDILIEKAVNTSFDLIAIQPLKSVIDLGKFLFKERSSM